MKNISSVLILIATIATTANAQIGLEAGLNMPNMAVKIADTKLQTGFKAGGVAGIIGDIKMDEHIYFQPGLFYQSAGCNITGTPTGDYTISTLTIPLNVVYKTGEKCSSRWLLGVGVYICDNLSGSYSIEAHGLIPASGGSLFGSDQKSTLKGLDMGAIGSIGFQTRKHFYFRLRYQMGLTNLSEVSDGGTSIHTSAIGLTIGYLFGGCNQRDAPFRNSSGSHWRGIKSGRNSRKVRNYHQPWLY